MREQIRSFLQIFLYLLIIKESLTESFVFSEMFPRMFKMLPFYNIMHERVKYFLQDAPQ